MQNIVVRIINNSPYELPHYATEHAAGMDLRAFIPEPVEIKPLQRFLIPTGLYIELPPGYEAQIRPRSGLAFKHGITVLNSPGTIDADYRGEIKVLLINLSDTPFTIQPGERIAQMVVTSHVTVQWKAVTELSDTVRNTGGFGSTGTQ